jgi:hypothetical protein
MLWFGSWITGDEGIEGSWFYSGRGGTSGDYPVPADATGLRVRRWPNEGFDAEFADILDLAGLSELFPGDLNFDVCQRFNSMAEYEHWPKV